MENEIILSSGAELMHAQEKAAIDTQVATAKMYPRDLKSVLNEIETIASMDEETAISCFYTLRRGNGSPTIGVSIRMAEIIASCWGNISVAGRIVADDGKMITAQGVCIDFQSNNRQSVEVKRRVTDKYGKRFSDDMVTVTCNAAIAIAKRNAIMSVIPRALTKKIVENVKQVSLGQAMDMDTKKTNCLAYYSKLGVSKEMICFYLGINSEADLTVEHINELRALIEELKNGGVNVNDLFIQPFKDKDKVAVKENASDILKESVAPTKGKEDGKK